MASVTVNSAFQSNVFQGNVFQNTQLLLVHPETVNIAEPKGVFQPNIFQSNVFQAPSDQTGVVVHQNNIQ